MKIKTNTLTGADLNRAVAMALGHKLYKVRVMPPIGVFDTCYGWALHKPDPRFSGFAATRDLLPNYCGDWVIAGPLIVEHSISLVRCDDDCGVDAAGWATNERIPVWAATLGQQGVSAVYGSQGDFWGRAYTIDEGETKQDRNPLVAAMRVLVEFKLGKEVELP